MKIELPKFEVFVDSNTSAIMVINPYWLEHLLNLFYQGYIAEVWEEIIDTEKTACEEIDNWGYGIIGQELNKKQNLCNSKDLKIDKNV